ncbi:MAG: two-component system sensor histidine kinase NtrB [Candidatus Anammoxibacter sp.]
MKKDNLQKHEIHKEIRFRLLVGIPIILAIFSLTSVILILNYFKDFMPLAFKAKGALPLAVEIIILVTIASISGLLIAYGITKPLQKLTSRAEDFIGKMGENPHNIKAKNEIEALTTVLDKAFVFLNELMQDKRILDGLPEGKITIDTKGKIIDFNKKIEDFFCCPHEQIKGRQIKELFLPQEYNKEFFDLVDKGWGGERMPFVETNLLLGDIKLEPLFVKTRLSDTNGQKSLMIIFKDPTDVKAIIDGIRKTEQFAFIGTLASGLAHEMRNPLGAIRGLTEMSMESSLPDDQRQLYANKIIGEVDRLNRIIEDILSLARDPKAEHEEDDSADINIILAQTISLSQYDDTHKDVRLTQKLQPNLPLICANSEKLVQAFMNLLKNAIEATPEGGKVGVETRKTNDGNILVSISDNGPGITQENLSLIFDPFFTTKAEGTGFGLPIVRHIINAHKGDIKVDSTPGHGTTFNVTLPVNEQRVKTS